VRFEFFRGGSQNPHVDKLRVPCFVLGQEEEYGYLRRGEEECITKQRRDDLFSGKAKIV